MQEVLERWDELAPQLAAIGEFPELLDTAKLAAPLPRAWQWLDGSVYSTHAELMQIAFGLDPIESDRPLMYQGMSDRFYGPTDDVRLPSEEHGIDFEGEFGVIVDHVPMGTSSAEALKHVRLLVQINDWSLRAIAPVEMKTGFGWIQAKPACSMAPFAVTPDELGDQWRDGRVCLDLHIAWNGRPFGRANGRPMLFGFGDLIAHAALTRDLVAGTIIGSGTVSNEGYREVGSSCISEVRAIEMIDEGKARTGFMRFGDRVRMEARATDGTAPFGAIDQQVVPA
jgi:fumarylacetoacetate (FAA) hydrolase